MEKELLAKIISALRIPESKLNLTDIELLTPANAKEELKKFNIITAKNGEVLGAYIKEIQTFINLSDDKTMTLRNEAIHGKNFVYAAFTDKDGKIIPLSESTKKDKNLNVSGAGADLTNGQDGIVVPQTELSGGGLGLSIASSTSRPHAFKITVGQCASDVYRINVNGNLQLSAQDIEGSKAVLIGALPNSSLVFEMDKKYYQDFGVGVVPNESRATFISNSESYGADKSISIVMGKELPAEVFLKYNGMVSPALQSTTPVDIEKVVLENLGDKLSGNNNKFEKNTISGQVNYFIEDVKKNEGRSTATASDGYDPKVQASFYVTANESDKLKKLEQLLGEDGITPTEKNALNAVKNIVSEYGDQLKHNANISDEVGKLFANTKNDVTKIKDTLGIGK